MLTYIKSIANTNKDENVHRLALRGELLEREREREREIERESLCDVMIKSQVLHKYTSNKS